MKEFSLEFSAGGKWGTELIVVFIFFKVHKSLIYFMWLQRVELELVCRADVSKKLPSMTRARTGHQGDLNSELVSYLRGSLLICMVILDSGSSNMSDWANAGQPSLDT